MVTLQSVQGHTGVTHPFWFFDILALWHSVPECQNVKKIKKGGFDQYMALNALGDSVSPQLEVLDWKGQSMKWHLLKLQF